MEIFLTVGLPLFGWLSLCHYIRNACQNNFPIKSPLLRSRWPPATEAVYGVSLNILTTFWARIPGPRDSWNPQGLVWRGNLIGNGTTGVRIIWGSHHCRADRMGGFSSRPAGVVASHHSQQAPGAHQGLPATNIAVAWPQLTPELKVINIPTDFHYFAAVDRDKRPTLVLCGWWDSIFCLRTPERPLKMVALRFH